MILQITNSQINNHMARGPYIFFIHDHEMQKSESLFKRIIKQDILFPDVMCYKITKIESLNKKWRVNLSDFEVCVVHKFYKNPSYLDPNDDEIMKLFLYIKVVNKAQMNEVKRIRLEKMLEKPEIYTKTQIESMKNDIRKMEF